MARPAVPAVKKQVKQSPPPQGDRTNIPEEVHRRASLVARSLMKMPAKPVKLIK